MVPPDMTGGQNDWHAPMHFGLEAGSPTSSYTVRPWASATTVPMEVDLTVRPLVWLLVVEPPPAGATDWVEPPLLLLPHAAAIVASAAAATAYVTPRAGESVIAVLLLVRWAKVLTLSTGPGPGWFDP